MNEVKADRRTGDSLSIDGNYQFRATHEGWAVQRFWHQVRFRECLKLISPVAGDSILDVGCGSGVFAAMMAESPSAPRVTGIDSNSNAVDFARRSFCRSNLSFSSGIVDDFQCLGGTVNKITFLEVIEHVPMVQAKEALRTFHDRLAPGGKLLISTPNRRSLWPLIEKTMDTLRVAAPMEGDQHVALYNEESLKNLGESCGFSLLVSKTIHTLAPWLAAVHWHLAEKMHGWEQWASLPWGSLIVQLFEKSTPK